MSKCMVGVHTSKSNPNVYDNNYVAVTSSQSVLMNFQEKEYFQYTPTILVNSCIKIEGEKQKNDCFGLIRQIPEMTVNEAHISSEQDLSVDKNM